MIVKPAVQGRNRHRDTRNTVSYASLPSGERCTVTWQPSSGEATPLGEVRPLHKPSVSALAYPWIKGRQ